MASDIWLRTILIVRKETHCRHIGYSYRLTARVLLYAPSHRQDNTYHNLCYTSRGAVAGMRNSSMGPPHEESIRRPIAPWANTLPLSYVPLLKVSWVHALTLKTTLYSSDVFNLTVLWCTWAAPWGWPSAPGPSSRRSFRYTHTPADTPGLSCSSPHSSFCGTQHLVTERHMINTRQPWLNTNKQISQL